jgi:hypothetical protein
VVRDHVLCPFSLASPIDAHVTIRIADHRFNLSIWYLNDTIDADTDLMAPLVIVVFPFSVFGHSAVVGFFLVGSRKFRSSPHTFLQSSVVTAGTNLTVTWYVAVTHLNESNVRAPPSKIRCTVPLSL